MASDTVRVESLFTAGEPRIGAPAVTLATTAVVMVWIGFGATMRIVARHAIKSSLPRGLRMLKLKTLA